MEREKSGDLGYVGMDDVQADLRNIGIINWRKKATDRREWMVIRREANVKLK